MRLLQTKAELIAHLREQLQFLRSSSLAFDVGNYGEAKRLAVILRILLHDTKRSASLLTSLGIKDKLWYYDLVGVADMDGGAHVDPTLEEEYGRLSRQNAFGWTVALPEGGAIDNGPQLAIVRQCAHEIELSLLEQMSELVPCS